MSFVIEGQYSILNRAFDLVFLCERRITFVWVVTLCILINGYDWRNVVYRPVLLYGATNWKIIK